MDPPEITFSFPVPGPISFKEWYLGCDENKINRYAAGDLYFNSYFYSINEITSINYEYSSDGTLWQDLTPYISSDNLLSYDFNQSLGSKIIRVNIGESSGIPDGEFHLRATCTNSDGNVLSEEILLKKEIGRASWRERV